MLFDRTKKGKKLEDDETKWLLVRIGGDHFIKNLIVDEKLFTFMVMRGVYPAQANLSVIGKYLGWHKGEDGKVYDKYCLNKERFNSYFEDINEHKEFVKEFNTYLNQTRKIVNNVADGSLEYYIFKTYFIKGQVKEFSKYDIGCEQDKSKQGIIEK